MGAQHLVLPGLGRLAVEVPTAREQGQAALSDDVVLVCVSEYGARELIFDCSELVFPFGE